DTAGFRAPLTRIDNAVNKQTGNARTKALEKALGELKDQHKAVQSNANAHRYVEFKIAEVTAFLALDDPTRRNEAIKLLTAFETANARSWTIVPALKMLARLQEDAKELDDARKTYEKLANVVGVPKELKQESEILVGRLLLRAGKYEDAQKRLEKLLG